jgi:hypothetical protein
MDRMNLAEKKGHDYADIDILSNFKRLSRLADILKIEIGDPYGYALFMALMKIDRINNLVASGNDPENESLVDSFMDLHNYIDLTMAVLIDEQEEPNEQPIPDGGNQYLRKEDPEDDKVVGSINSTTP